MWTAEDRATFVALLADRPQQTRVTFEPVAAASSNALSSARIDIDGVACPVSTSRTSRKSAHEQALRRSEAQARSARARTR
jgi:hypothetical protein